MKKGLSIMEVLVVIVIMGIITSIAVPLIGNLIDKIKKEAFIADINAIQTASSIYCNSNLENEFCLKEELTLRESSILSPYISKNFNDYKTANVISNEGFYVNLKDDFYETREIRYSSNDKCFMYTQKEILPNSKINNYVIKNKN